MSLPIKRAARAVALSLSLLVVQSTLSRPARADTAAAQVLFDDAKKLMASGNYAEACPKLAESQRLDPGIGTQFNLATCYEKLGNTASAWSLFLEVAGAAKAAGQADREKVARQRAAALEPKLMRLTIVGPPDAPPDLQVRRDGVAVGTAQLGSAIPVDPGKHTIEAMAAGKAPFKTEIEVSKAGRTETVEIPPLEQGAAMPPGYAYPPPPGVMVPGYPPPAKQAPKTKRRSGGMMAGGIVLISLGAVAGLTGGAIIGVCQSGGVACPENAGVGLVIGGVVGLGAGIPLTIIGAKKVPVDPATDKDKDDDDDEASAAPVLFVGPGGATLRGVF